jgi:putative membrane protein
MKNKFGWAFAILGLVSIACDDDDNKSLNDTDRNFITNASEGNLAEIRLGELAATRASAPGVKAFGQMMVTEHQTALDELEAIGDDKDVNLTTTLNAKHEAMRQKLMNMTGHSFDTAYMRSQVKDHEVTVALFKNEISAGSDPQVKGYATKYLHHIEMHLAKADSISDAIENK